MFKRNKTKRDCTKCKNYSKQFGITQKLTGKCINGRNSEYCGLYEKKQSTLEKIVMKIKKVLRCQ